LIFLVVLSIMKGIQSGMISISRLLRSFSSESGDESKLLPSRYFASDNVNLLDTMENDKMGRLGRYFVAKSAATR